MSKEYIKNVFQKFDDHLSIDNNSRVIFSGKFGIGKSYFLSEFFKDENYEQQYFPIFLNPVNYSIASNEDIFELIKFDILFQILSKDVIDFENLKFSKGNLLHQYFSNKFLEDFVSTTDLIGENIMEEQVSGSFNLLKNLGKLIGKLSEVSIKDFENFKGQIQKNPELETINKFLEQQQNKLGSFYENNAITQLIYDLIKNIEKVISKKTVLVIDDLDRIDPEHIFRILNVFSAHVREDENKFGIEKVVLVCDLKNIKSIYHHFYGENVDFFGYINKFYSFEPYQYSNVDYIKWFDENFPDDQYNSENVKFLRYIFSDAIFKNYISARQLFNNDFSKIGILKYHNSINSQKYSIIHKNKDIPLFSLFRNTYSIIKTIVKYFGNENNFLKYIDSIEYNHILKFQNLLGEFYLFIDFKKEKNYPTKQSFTTTYNFTIDYEYDKFKIIGDINHVDLKSFFKDLINQYQDIIEIN
jgi:hypothetical protein